MNAPAGTPRPGAGQPAGSGLAAAFVGVALGAILVPLNSTMLAVALPSLMADFGVGPATVASLVTLYLGAVTVAMPASGAIGDRLGHRRVFLAGVAAFALASIVGALAPSFPVLVASRIGQAVAGASISTNAAALVRAMAPADRRGTSFGVFELLVSASAAAGPIVGGLLVAAFGWRSLFVVAAPVAAASAVVVAVVLPAALSVARRGGRPLDLRGLGLLAAALVALVALMAGDLPPGAAAATTVAGAAVAVLFVRHELGSAAPAVDVRLFARRPFAAAVLAVLGATVVLHGTLVVVPLAVEGLLGGHAAESGLALLGVSGLGALAAPLGGRLSDRSSRRLPAVVGALVMAAALLVLALVGPLSLTLLVGLLAVAGFGLGFSGPPRLVAALESVSPAQAGMAAGTYMTGRYLGGVLGATLAGTVLAAGVSRSSVALAFVLLAVVALAVAAAGAGLQGRRSAAVSGPD
ncbi:MAG TPA: MFS transporter [Candidatus Limnocylindrales bacterium]|nr:MFS transporter [Candidatus Limnocylindrales bacterium]